MAMQKHKRERLESRGWKVGTVDEFLDLTPEESRVAKMESADTSVSLDLLIRSLLALGVTNRQVAAVLANA